MAAPSLSDITKYYLGSRDFNGLYFHTADKGEIEAVAQLVEDGSVQVVADGVDYLNPHIRPWQSRRTIDEQVESLRNMTEYGVCLYPTPAALKKVRVPTRFRGRPYSQEMAKGKGTLELAYFRFDVLEQYRNDPRFHFRSYDFGATMSFGNEEYVDEDEPDEDKTGMQHIGFAYDLSGYNREDPDSPVIRRVCAFYGDLMRLTPTHQQRWKTYEVSAEGLNPHPMWWGQQMGHWADGPGPFESFFFELKNLNELFERAHGEALFKVVDRPDDFGWILRPSQHEWDNFVHQLDKLLSENMRPQALAAAGAFTKDKDGKPLGTLNQLASVLERQSVAADAVRGVLKSLRDVRQARQKPAHSLRTNVTDKTFVHKQIHMMEQVNGSLDALRHFWQTHPANKDWKPRYSETEKSYRM